MSPIREAWRALWRAPALIACEIVWRWTFGVAFWAIAVASIRAVLANIKISEAEYQLLANLAPVSLPIAVAHLLQELGPAVRRLSPVLLPALAIAWLSCASVGRFATLKVLLPHTRTNWRSIFIINVIRLVVTAAALLAFVSAALMMTRHVGPDPKQVWAELLAMLMMAALIVFFWSLLNGFLSLASIWAVRDGSGPFAAIKDSVSLLNDRPGPYIATWSWIEFLRFLVIIGAWFLMFLGAARITATSAAVVVAGVTTVILTYLIFMDFIQIWRIAAYVALANDSEATPVLENNPMPVTSIAGAD